ncbi:MAG: Rrf2 family transcriptional regulator [Proteobacteria bacterium]|nr:Rrf2 family transcriptional regulator [Pseudomonadota bacterium]
MLFPIKVDYGLRMLIDLAQQPVDSPATSSDIASRQAIPEAFVVQLFMTLTRSGMVASRRGPKGGHVLAMPAAEISVAEVVQAFDRSIAPVGCLHSPEDCTLSSACSQRELWSEVEQILMDVLSKTSVADLAEKQRILTAAHA